MGRPRLIGERQGRGLKCRGNSLHSTKKNPSRFPHTWCGGRRREKNARKFLVLLRRQHKYIIWQFGI